MISIPVLVLNTFRTLVRKAGLHKRRMGAKPGLSFIFEGDACLIRCASQEVAIQYRHEGSFTSQEHLLPLDSLDGIRGKRGDSVMFQSAGNDRTSISWTERGVPRETLYNAPEAVPFPSVPTSFVPNEPVLWSALRDAVPVADAGSSRYALGCLHLRGKPGRIEATDGRHVLTQAGFQFPWDDDLLLPANGVVGCKALDNGEPVQVGRAGDWVGFGVGNWLVMVAIQKEGRYPKLDDVIPKPEAATARLDLSPDDASFLAEVLPGLPCDDPVHDPITLDLNGQVLLRTREPDKARPTQVELPGARLGGEPIVLTTNRRYLAQALRLGFRAAHCYGANSPILCADERRRFLWCVLDAESAIPRHDDPVRISPRDTYRPAKTAKRAAADVQPNQPTEVPMTVPINQSQVPASAPQNDPKPAKRTRIRPAASTIEQALSLRDALRGVAQQAGELARSLKQQKRQARIVASTLASLKELENVVG